MSGLKVTDKRKRGETGAHRFLTEQDQAVLNVIKKKQDLGIFKGDIRMETKFIDRDINKALKNLVTYNLIKEVVNIKNKSKKHYMGVDYEPSKEISGGAWYADGKLDTELIDALKKACGMVTKKASTIDVIFERVKRVNADLTKQQLSEILNSMVLSNEVIEVKSTGVGEYHSVPIGTICYKNAGAVGLLDKGPKVGAMASIPCGACPRISKCTPDGVISPSTCVYYTKWLDISF